VALMYRLKSASEGGLDVVKSLNSVELIPVVELEPFAFATSDRKHPSSTGPDEPQEWSQYWYDALADSGVVGLTPLRPGSWHVPVAAFTNPVVLGQFLEVEIRRSDGIEALTDPDQWSTLSGGLALCSGGEVLIEPTCCGDLGNLSDWRNAVVYRQADWMMVWIGHPWVSVRFDLDQLIFSEPHESNPSNARWAISPEILDKAVTNAEVELEVFARRLHSNLTEMGVLEANPVARKMAGLER
jgi:hypothetical protein